MTTQTPKSGSSKSLSGLLPFTQPYASGFDPGNVHQPPLGHTFPPPNSPEFSLPA